MEWAVVTTDEFDAWFESLNANQQGDLLASLLLLQAEGPQLGRPHADSVQGSRHANLKELRTQSGGRPLRTFFAFDPTRTGVVLIGGDKTGDTRFYKRMIPKADDIYDRHLASLKKGN